MRDAQNGSTITGSLANQSARPINSVMLTFVLYDEQGREIGRVQDGVTGPLAPGQIRLVRAVTLPAARVTALDAGLVAHASMRPFYFAGIGNRARHVTRPKPGRADPAPPVRSGALGSAKGASEGTQLMGKLALPTR